MNKNIKTAYSTKKEWYKHGWGLVAAILLLPFFVIWYAWAKSNWSKNVKIFATAAAGLFIIIVAVVNGSGNKSVTTTTTTPQPQQATTTTQETKPAPVFDIPVLVGKNIDEVRKVLGKPADADPEPTQEQIELGADEWYNGYKKDGVELTITFNPKTRKITDFFLSGDNRNKLMEQGNLQNNQSAYRIEEVKALRGGGITGIKIIPQ